MDHKRVFTEYRCINLIYPYPVSPKDSSWLIVVGKEPDREWQEIHCDGQASGAKNAIEEFSRIGRTLRSMQDTIHGVRLNFGPRTEWNTVIAAVDAALMDSAATFWLNDSSIRSWWVPPAPPPSADMDTFPVFSCDVIPICGTLSMPPTVADRISASLGHMRDGLAHYWPPTVLFLMLAAVSMKDIHRTVGQHHRTHEKAPVSRGFPLSLGLFRPARPVRRSSWGSRASRSRGWRRAPARTSARCRPGRA